MRLDLALLLAAAALASLAPSGARAARCPTVTIVLDRSASMLDAGKWGAAVSSIGRLTHSLSADLAPRQARERFGLMVFPALDPFGCAPGASLVSADFFAADAIDAALALSTPLGGATPTGESLAAAAGLPELQDASRPRFVLLITDGVPNCAPTFPAPGDDAPTRAYAVQEVGALLAQGVKTYVIGFGRFVDATVLDQMAAAGGAARAGAHGYYEALDEAGLTAAFDAIDRVEFGEGGPQACDDSCYAIGCPQGQVCVADPRPHGSYTLNLGQCVADPCAAVACPGGATCIGGTCQLPCRAGCARGERCADGTCQADPCYPNGCTGCPTCAAHLVCTRQGTCGDDPCNGVRCPAGAPVCAAGGCQAAPAGTDAGASDGPGGITGHVAEGCSCSSAEALGSALMLAAAALAPLARRRRAR